MITYPGAWRMQRSMEEHVTRLPTWRNTDEYYYDALCQLFAANTQALHTPVFELGVMQHGETAVVMEGKKDGKDDGKKQGKDNGKDDGKDDGNKQGKDDGKDNGKKENKNGKEKEDDKEDDKNEEKEDDKEDDKDEEKEEDDAAVDDTEDDENEEKMAIAAKDFMRPIKDESGRKRKLDEVAHSPYIR